MGTATGVLAGLADGLAVGVIIGIAIFLGFGTMAALASRAWPMSLTFVQLSARWHIPVRIMKFLEDARQRNVLRTIGPVYQFRHAQLQDRLSEHLPANNQSSVEARS
jgi:hypothetical protein